MSNTPSLPGHAVSYHIIEYSTSSCPVCHTRKAFILSQAHQHPPVTSLDVQISFLWHLYELFFIVCIHTNSRTNVRFIKILTKLLKKPYRTLQSALGLFPNINKGHLLDTAYCSTTWTSCSTRYWIEVLPSEFTRLRKLSQAQAVISRMTVIEGSEILKPTRPHNQHCQLMLLISTYDELTAQTVGSASQAKQGAPTRYDLGGET